jgi:hypothetical protein
MAVKIDIKHNNVAGVVPTTSSLNLGEIAINTYDGRVFIKKDNGTPSIIEIGGGGASGVSQILTGSGITISPSTGTGIVTISSTGGSGSPGGSTTQIQYNNAGTFAGVPTLTYSGSLLIATGSFTGSFTGSLQGTATTASYVANAQTASYIATASWANNALTASYVNPLTQTVIITGSLISSGSNTFIGSQTVTGSLSTSGSNTLIGNTVLSGSIGISGSSTIQGTTTMTGSLNITGSTSQIGSNTLIGNTLLSGSIIISGSQGPGALTASVQIYGDIRQSGYHRFDPVTTNLDQSVSASYIYVSGSTNDLYFAQSGNGYANNVRLRWLEGGSLYTGLLRGGVITSTPGTTTFNITSGSGLLVTMNASTASEPFPTVQYISWPNFTSQPIINSGSAKITYVGIDSNSQIIQQVVPWGTNDINQWDNSLSLGVVLHLSGSVSSGVFNAPQISYGGQQKADDFFRAFGPLKISGHTLQASGSTLGLTKLAGTSYREGANYVINANHPSTVVENSINTSKIYRYYISGSTPVIDTGVANAGYTVIDPTQRVNTTTGALTGVSNNKYSLQRVFWVPNSPTNAFIVYYGNEQYNSLIDAVNAKDSEPFSEAPNTSQNSIFLGYIAVAGGAANLTNASDATIVQGGLFRSVGGVGSGGGTNYVSTTLAGLADVTLTSLSNNQLLAYNSGTSKWNNVSNITASILGNLTGTANTASYVNGNIFTGTNVVSSASFATTASYALNAGSSTFPYTGNAVITGSLTVSGSTTPILKLIGSGSAILQVSGSLGGLFQVSDTNTGNLFSVQNSTGNNLFVVSSSGDLTVGTSTLRSLYATTTATLFAGITTIYSVATSSYRSIYFDYNVMSASNARAGQIMAMWSGSSVNYTEVTTTDFGDTSGVVFGVSISGANMILSSSAATANWTFNSIIRSI